MDDELVQSFFLQPSQTLGRHYEILRGYFIEQRTIDDLAAAYGMNYYTVRAQVRRFRDQCQRGRIPPFSSNPISAAPLRKQDRAPIPNQRPLPAADSCS